jgi:DNA-binding beta-propeller fold protein YncE
MHRVASITAAIALALVSASTAAATPPPYGGLTQRPGAAGCIANSALAPCTTLNGFYYPSDAQMTPDGKQLLLIDPGSDALVAYNRAPDGSLSYGFCISKTGAAAGAIPCAANGFLGSAKALAVSPDGRSVYVMTTAPLLLTFSRSATGVLTLNHCFAKTSSFLCAGANGLSGAQSLAADGSLLVVGGDHAVSVFSRSADGSLTTRGCVGDGSDAACLNGGAAYWDLEGVGVAPDDRAVYAAARNSDSLLTVGYDPASGTLTQKQCLSGASGPPAGCTAAAALFAPSWVTASPTGAGAPAVYVADYNAGEVATFTRNADDTLAQLACRSFDGSIGGTPGVCQADPRLQNVGRVMVSADGRNVYAIAARGNPKQGAQAITIFNRDQNSGLITPLQDPNGCWANSDTGPTPGCQTAHGMADPVAMALSPAGDQLYVAVTDDQGDSGGPHPPGGIAIFNREIPPTCTPASASTPAGTPVTLALSCSGANGLPVTVSVLAGPAHGVLGTVGPTGQVRFTPPASFIGSVPFTFAASDGSLSSPAAIATVTVSAQGPPPHPAPALTLLRLSSGRFAVRQPHHHRRIRLGTTVSWTDSVAATTTLNLTSSATGIVSGKRCAPSPRHQPPHARRCTRTIAVGSLVHHDHTGGNSLGFGGRIGRRLLVPGRYRLTLVARLNGKTSRPVSTTFTVAG